MKARNLAFVVLGWFVGGFGSVALAQDAASEEAAKSLERIVKLEEELKQIKEKLAEAPAVRQPSDIEPPAAFKAALDAAPWGISVGAALGINFAGFGDYKGEPALVAMPYFAWRMRRGDITESYCAARKYGEPYAQEVADDYARRSARKGLGRGPKDPVDDAEVEDETGWTIGNPSPCSVIGQYGFGVFVGGILPHKAEYGISKQKVERDVRTGVAFGVQYQISAISLMVGPSFVFVAHPDGGREGQVTHEFGLVAGLGGSLDFSRLAKF